jgi:UDP-N-acetylglucosamine/UDP-N-acetylgalactosamine diphosphorylase
MLKEKLLEQQRALIGKIQNFPIPEPAQEFDIPDEAADLNGKELISEGKVACLILAGGQATRLGIGPKALVPVTAVRKKTLLQLACEKTAAASKAYKTSLQMAIMTSSANHTAIETYLQENNYFGLNSSVVHLFIQENTPFVDEQGNWILENDRPVEGPDGNGHCLRLLMQTGIGEKWKEQGIESVSVVPIDNPLADPFDASLCGYRAIKDHDAVIKAIKRHNNAEKVGVIVRHDKRISVQEYSELPENFEAPLAHIGLFCFRLSFIERIASIELPWHLAKKKYADRMIWKFERFLFDVLHLTKKTGILVYPREDVYAPLKNFEGVHSLATVQEAITAFDRRLIHYLTKSELSHTFELDPAFYYLTEDLKAQWEGKSVPNLDYLKPQT